MWKFWKKRDKTEADKMCDRERTRIIEASKANLEKETQTMLSKYCPIQKGICSSDCAHFVHGKVWYSFQITKLRPFMFCHSSPRCLLLGR
jgi:hypothetical protein